jgi:hypothetical protein
MIIVLNDSSPDGRFTVGKNYKLDKNVVFTKMATKTRTLKQIENVVLTTKTKRSMPNGADDIHDEGFGRRHQDEDKMSQCHHTKTKKQEFIEMLWH